MARAFSLLVTSLRTRRPKSDRVGYKIKDILYAYGFQVFANEPWEDGLTVGGLSGAPLDPTLIHEIERVLELEGIKVVDHSSDLCANPKGRAVIAITGIDDRYARDIGLIE